MFFDMRFKVKNLDKFDIGLSGIFTDLTMDYNKGYIYKEHSFYFGQGDDISVVYDWDRLEPLIEVVYHAVIKVPRSIVDDGKPIKITFKVVGLEQILTVR